MGLIPFGGIKVSREHPTISVRIVNTTDDLASAELFIQRVGAYNPVVVYVPSSVVGDYLEFTLDELFFEEPPGRYTATCKVNSIKRVEFQLQYDDENPTLVYNKATP